MLHSNTVPDTIADFGRQWVNYTDNSGYYGSMEAFQTLLEPLLVPAEIKGRTTADVGAGTGRHSRLLHALGASPLWALEPSQAFEVLQQNVGRLPGVVCQRLRAEQLPPLAFDLIFCIGVLQFIPDAVRALTAMGRALKPDGQLFLWVYGRENNRFYLSLLKPLRTVTTRLPHALLDYLTEVLVIKADLYAWLSRYCHLPLQDYLQHYYSRLSRYHRKLVIYDQLNPRLARYYTRAELLALLKACGFEDIRIHHRYGYSWSVLARYAGA